MSDITNKVSQWQYFFQFDFINVIVCQMFLCFLFKVGKRRFTTIQKKLKNNESPKENRGNHANSHNNSVKLSADLKKMILEHCPSIPNSQSHCCRKSSRLNYFNHPDSIVTNINFISFFRVSSRKDRI